MCSEGEVGELGEAFLEDEDVCEGWVANCGLQLEHGHLAYRVLITAESLDQLGNVDVAHDGSKGGAEDLWGVEGDAALSSSWPAQTSSRACERRVGPQYASQRGNRASVHCRPLKDSSYSAFPILSRPCTE
jgi:hypothetical protein